MNYRKPTPRRTLRTTDSHLDFLAVDLDGLHREVDANGVALVLGVRAALETLHDARFAGAAIADQHDLEQEVEVVFGRHHRDAGCLRRRRRRRRAGCGRTGRLGHGGGGTTASAVRLVGYNVVGRLWRLRTVTEAHNSGTAPGRRDYVRRTRKLRTAGVQVPCSCRVLTRVLRGKRLVTSVCYRRDDDDVGPV